MKKTHITMKLLPILAALLTCINVNAYDIEVDNIYYDVNLDDMTASVTSGDNLYTGNIVIPSSIAYKGREFHVVSLDNISFKNCPDLISVTIRDGIEDIKAYAFSGSKKLAEVVLPNTLTNLGENSFENCESLESLEIPNGIKSIPNRCFTGCRSLSHVNIPQSVTTIEQRAFYFCSSLSHIELPHSLQRIGAEAFEWSGLVSISIPNSVSTIEAFALGNCLALQNVIFNDGNTPLVMLFVSSEDIDLHEGDFLGASPLESLHIGRFISNITISEDLNILRINVTKLKTVSFGKYSNKSLDFTYAQELEEVYCKFTDPSDVTVSFSNKTYLNATLFVPTGTKEKFEKADGWKNFFSIQEFDMDETAVKAIKQTNGIKQYYNLDGKKPPYPNKGVNIIRSSNGETHKILIR